MLAIINSLEPFFEDCYNELGVREFSRLVGVTPPTASKLLKESESEGLLKSRKERGYFLFRAERESLNLKDLSRIYWRQKLKALIKEIGEQMPDSQIILFGSLSKLEAKKDSDIDIAVISLLNKTLNIDKFRKLYNREIQIFYFRSQNKISPNLKEGILGGFILKE